MVKQTQSQTPSPGPGCQTTSFSTALPTTQFFHNTYREGGGSRLKGRFLPGWGFPARIAGLGNTGEGQRKGSALGRAQQVFNCIKYIESRWRWSRCWKISARPALDLSQTIVPALIGEGSLCRVELSSTGGFRLLPLRSGPGAAKVWPFPIVL